MILFAEDPSLWIPRESVDWPGCYRPPFPTSSNILFTCEGNVLDASSGVRRKTRISTKGYCLITVRHKNKYHVCSIHRAIAVLFVPKPERHKDIPYDELQVNHIDGNKLNNHYSNLEWVTQEENMEHARRLGLFSNDVSCYARDVITGEVFTYRSISECARQHCVPVTGLAYHVTSKGAGRIVGNGCVYMLADNEWPEMLLYEGTEANLGKTTDVLAENLLTGQKILASTFKGACDYLRLNFVNVRNSRNRKGYDVPYDGWVFRSFEDYLKETES